MWWLNKKRWKSRSHQSGTQQKRTEHEYGTTDRNGSTFGKVHRNTQLLHSGGISHPCQPGRGLYARPGVQSPCAPAWGDLQEALFAWRCGCAGSQSVRLPQQPSSGGLVDNNEPNPVRQRLKGEGQGGERAWMLRHSQQVYNFLRISHCGLMRASHCAGCLWS